jgi:DNA sulfur modification protein DndB
MNAREMIVEGKELESEKTERGGNITKNVPPTELDSRLKEGWVVVKKYNNHVRVKKMKLSDELFENRVWKLFYNLGFKYMNKGRHFNMPYSSDGKLTQQIDVFAADDETALFIECKMTDVPNNKKSFKESIEAIGGKTQGIRGELRKMFPNKELKTKFVFATNNYEVGDQDKQRMKEFEIIHFDQTAIQYYEDLYKHLGASAKYQLLGNLFAGQKIPGLLTIVPAIEGKMGGHTYYSFSIEPERLLKLGYIMHRNNANEDGMFTYQRLIKKARLGSIKEFIDDRGGFFPNSIIVNINAKDSLKFDRASLQDKNSTSRIGLLHLPPIYKSIYIIDGQHRLYGYAESEYKNKHAIPTVAFVNLKSEEQVKMFMGINENQKSVSKNLRNTLNADLLYGSKDPSQQREGMILSIALKLGEEDRKSPLYGRMIIGENSKNQKRCITTEIIKNAMLQSGFLFSYNKNAIIKEGTLDKGNNEDTERVLYPLISKSLSHIRQNLSEKWEKGESDNNYICINVAIYGYIRIINDIIQHLMIVNNFHPKKSSPEEIFIEIKCYLDVMIAYLRNLSPEKGMELRTMYGGKGPVLFWRTMQKAISDQVPEFNPNGMEKYWTELEKENTVQSIKLMMEKENSMKDILEKNE